MSTTAAAATADAPSSSPATTPVVILVVGMAGTGKSTLVHRMQHYAQANQLRSYFINMDPAVTHTSYHVNVDIRDSVDYAAVMKNYRLGPNGAIMTALNLFATKVHQVVTLLEAKKASLDWIVIDTPGQIEVFTWSASGQLIAEALAAALPTVLLFVADTVRCTRSPHTFVSTMLYSSGIMLKQQLPLVVAFNKTDVVSAGAVVRWMRESDSLDMAIANSGGGGDDDDDISGSGGGAVPLSTTDGGLMFGSGSSYAGTLAQSMSLFLHEFYEELPYAAVSAATGAGMEDLAAAIQRAKESKWV